jgi:hypothetical protein
VQDAGYRYITTCAVVVRLFNEVKRVRTAGRLLIGQLLTTIEPERAAVAALAFSPVAKPTSR